MDSALPYAREDMFGLVMLFSIDRTLEAEKGIAEMAGQLIDLADGPGGNFYLPYRNSCDTRSNQEKLSRLFRVPCQEKEVDPREIFSSGFYQQYR